jgi:hypothetical protein
MGNQPWDDPFPGVGIDDFKPNNIFTPFLNSPPGDVEAEAGEDDVPHLVGDSLKFPCGPLSDIGGHVPFFDLFDDATLPFAQYDRFNSGASGTVYRAQVFESHSIIAATPCEPQPSDASTGRSVKSSNIADVSSSLVLVLVPYLFASDGS